MMTEEEKNKIVEEAKLRYPIGTKFKSSMNLANTATINTEKFFWWRNNSDLCANTHGGISVWTKGRWAEIISLPVPKIINDYQIY